MDKVRAFFVSVAAGVLLSLPSLASPATDCVALPPLEPIHRICGVVFVPSGDRISNAEVSVLQGDKEIAEQRSDKDGKFSFEGLKAGNYEIRVRVEHFGTAFSRIVLTRPEAETKRELAVKMSLSGSCSSISLASSKQLEAGLNPPVSF